MKKFLILFSIIASVMITGCAKPQIVRIFPQEELSRIAIEEIINDKELTSEEKATLVQMKMAEDIERKKRAVEMEKDNKLSNIINRPVTPLRTPDTILRVLILPYEDDNGVLNGWKYSYVKVDDGKWVMADYLNGSVPSSKMTLTPLKTESNSNNIGSTGMAPAINNNDIKYTVKSIEEDMQVKIKQLKSEKQAVEKAKKAAEKERKKAEKEKAKQEKVKQQKDKKLKQTQTQSIKVAEDTNQDEKEQKLPLDNTKQDNLTTNKSDSIDTNNSEFITKEGLNNDKVVSAEKEETKLNEVIELETDNQKQLIKEVQEQPLNVKNVQKADTIDMKQNHNINKDTIADKTEKVNDIKTEKQNAKDIISDNKTESNQLQIKQPNTIVQDSIDKDNISSFDNQHKLGDKEDNRINSVNTDNNDNISNNDIVIKDERPRLFNF